MAHRNRIIRREPGELPFPRDDADLLPLLPINGDPGPVQGPPEPVIPDTLVPVPTPTPNQDAIDEINDLFNPPPLLPPVDSDDGGGGGGDGGGGGGGSPPGTGQPITPIGTGDPAEDPFLFNTIGTPIPGVPDTPSFEGDAGPNLVTQDPTGEGITKMNPDGSITPGAVDPTTREVQSEELVSEQLSGLLASDSKFIQDARRQGLEQANALGGLGGTVGAGASMQAAIRAGLPIAQADAQAMQLAASQNMEALNQFASLNLQRTTQLELANIDSRTRTQITQIGTSAQLAAARLTSATQRDIAFADNETKLRITEMSGQIQDRLATFQFQYNTLLRDQEAANNLGGIALTGQFALENQDRIRAFQKESQYFSLVTNAMGSYTEQIAALNGVEMDQAARDRAIATINQGATNLFNLINSMYPDYDPIVFGGSSGNTGGGPPGGQGGGGGGQVP